MRMHAWPLEDDVTKDLGRKQRGPSNGEDRERNERLERLGLMATASAGLAHDLNTPLAALSLQLAALAKDLYVAEQTSGAVFDDCRSSLVALEETSDFMRRMVRDFVRSVGGPGIGGTTTPVRQAVEVAVRMT